MTSEVATTVGNGIARQEFGANEVQRSAETAATAVAAQAEATIKARYWLAVQRPREWMDVGLRLEKECMRPGFAKSAWYEISNRGHGFTIRFAEAALRCMTNAYPETMVVFESERQRIVKVSVTDLEANLTYSQDVLIEKAVERSKSDGRDVISERTNSYGKKTYRVAATEDEMLGKQNALISKTIRTLALRLIPGDIQDRCKALIEKTRHDETAKDPDAARLQIVRAFAAQGLSAADITAYLGHQIERATVKQLNELIAIGTAIKEGETTWRAVMDSLGDDVTGSEEAQKEVLERKLAEARGEASAKTDGNTTSESSDEPKTLDEKFDKAKSEEKLRFGQGKRP